MALYGFIATVVAALLTSFYSWRLIFKTFHGEPHDPHHYEGAHESPMTMLVPLAVLVDRRDRRGLCLQGGVRGASTEEFFRESLKLGPVMEAMHHVPLAIALLPSVMMAVGFAVAWQFYVRRPDLPVELANQQPLLYRFLLNKWYFDEVYDVLIVRPAIWFGRLLWKGGDGLVIDGLGPDGVSARVIDVTRGIVRLQTGYLYHYAFAMLIGVAALITWFMFGGPH